MIESMNLSKTLRLLVGLACFGVAVIALQPFVSLFNSVFLALILVLCVAPVLHWLKGKGLPNWLAFLLTLFAIIGVVVILVLFLAYSLGQLAEAVPGYVAQLDVAKDSLASRIASLGIDPAPIQVFLKLIDPERLINLVADFLAGLVGAISDVVLVVLVIAFLMVESFSLPARLQKLAPFGAERWERAAKFGSDTRRYVVITTYVGAVTGFGNAVLLLILGVDFAVLWGVVAFLLSYIPVVGFWLALIPPFILALLEFGPPAALVVLAGFALINGSAENIVKPKLMGEGLDLAPSVVFLSLIFWTAILGPMGAILALPMTMAVKQLILEADEQNHWVAALISSVGSEKEGADERPANDDSSPASEE
jgi:predicted PurR-regulated permease PerM